MEINAVQNRIVKSKTIPCMVLRGGVNSGKTATAVCRGIYLKNNYCLYEDDKILITAKSHEKLNKIKELYEILEKEIGFEYTTLFSTIIDKAHLYRVDDIINKYFIDFMKSNKVNYNIISDISEKREIIHCCIEEIKRYYPGVKAINYNNINFFINEVKWIKSCNLIELSDYQRADRLGRKGEEGPKRLLKNSKDREAIYNLMLLYNKILREKKLIDLEDKTLFALNEVKKSKASCYTHMVIDESENLTKVELELLKSIRNEKAYGSFIFTYNKEEQNDPNAWLIKGRKLTFLNFNSKIKNCLFKNSNGQVETHQKNNCSEEEKKAVKALESYEYCDIRHHKSFSFVRDISNLSEIVLNDEAGDNLFSEEELKELPVYNDIAAGEPIYINPEMEDKFHLPLCWLKGMKECFMLKVKGDSMINANINDGDFVVIRRQSIAQNNDIVAVDLEGSATLKRLKIHQDKVMLMPENEKYKPIPINDEGARVLGVAVGVLKNKG